MVAPEIFLVGVVFVTSIVHVFDPDRDMISSAAAKVVPGDGILKASPEGRDRLPADSTINALEAKLGPSGLLQSMPTLSSGECCRRATASTASLPVGLATRYARLRSVKGN